MGALIPEGPAEMVVLPDGRRRFTRFYGVLASALEVAVLGTPASPGSSGVMLAWGTADDEFTGARLVDQRASPAPQNAGKQRWIRVYEEIPATAEVRVGQPSIAYDEFGRRVTTVQSIQFTAGTLAFGTFGTTTAPDDTASVLSGGGVTDDGRLRTITRQYTQAGASLEQLGSDSVDTEINGLRRRTQMLIGRAGASDPSGTVGTTTHPTDTTLILAGKKVETSGSIKRAQLVWMEPGVISKSRSKAEGGITQYTWVSVGTQQNPPGTIIAVTESNPSGYVQWTVTSLANADDEDLVGTAGAAKLAFQYQQFVNFPLPGTVDIEEYVVPDPGNGVAGEGIRLIQTPPVEIKVTADVFVFFQESASIASGDKTYDSAVGLWNPSSWPAISSQYTPVGRSQVRQSEGFRGYRMADLSESPKTISVQTQQTGLAWTNAVVFGTICNGGNGFAPVHSATLSGGPDDPDGVRYVLDVDIRQAFEKADGTIVYKKVIVVATITPA